MNLTPRETNLANIVKALRYAVTHYDQQWPESELSEPMMHGDTHHYHKGKVNDAKLIKQGADIIDHMLVAADGIHALMTLAARDRKAFDAIVILAQIELDRKPSEVAA